MSSFFIHFSIQYLSFPHFISLYYCSPPSSFVSLCLSFPHLFFYLCLFLFHLPYHFNQFGQLFPNMWASKYFGNFEGLWVMMFKLIEMLQYCISLHIYPIHFIFPSLICFLKAPPFISLSLCLSLLSLLFNFPFLYFLISCSCIESDSKSTVI